MAGVEAKSMGSPDEVRTPDKTKVDVVTVAGNEVGRFTFQPGWRWSECIKPLVGADSCQGGTTADIGPGDAYVITPGHQAWFVGDEEFVGVEFKSAAEYAKG